ncbi:MULTISPECIES: putative polysaccharide biosynthesis protein [Cohnella]|uniref:putative polysaccharide biosynthesis protein n=1 Tax=Cohnella TaxID=329857 RepID=UPI000E395CBD|nr:polysaccharide biosynthesis protein [Cohnella sp.]REK60543.1 MAG: hypothetical protein C6P35_18680 [Cohnella sp.]
MPKKDSLIKGTLILTLAALVARGLGLFQRVPLDHLWSTKGGLAFGAANNIYLLLLVFATAGIPSAISKMVSERLELGREAEVQRIYRAALRFGVIAGIVMTAGLLIAAPLYARLSHIPYATLAIRAIAPSLLLFPVIAMMRGYFQGRQFMTAGGISQIVEQIARVLTAVALAYALAGWGYDDSYIAAGAAFGSVLGSIGAFAVMLWYAYKLRQADRGRTEPASAAAASAAGAPSKADAAANAGAGGPPVLTRTRDIYAAIFRISIPILLTAMMVQVIYFFDQTVLIPLSDWKFGAETAERWGDWLTIRAQSIAGIPPILAIALSTSLLPVVSAAYASRDMDRVRRQSSLAMRIAVLSAMPLVLVLTTAAHPVTGLIFKTAEGSAIVAVLTGGTIFQISMMVSNSILNGLGLQRKAMAHSLAGIGVKIALSFALTPFFGIYGLLAATSVCFIFVTVWNMRTIRGIADVKVLGGRWPGFAAAVAVLAAIGAALAHYAAAWFSPLGWRWPYLLAAALTGAVVCGAYPVLLVALGVVRAEDVDGFPAKLRKLIKPFLRLRPKALQRGDGV